MATALVRSAVTTVADMWIEPELFRHHQAPVDIANVVGLLGWDDQGVDIGGSGWVRGAPRRVVVVPNRA